MKKVYAIERLCLNCRLCEVYCKTAHSKSKDIIKAYKQETPEPVSRIIVEGDNKNSLAINCRHCDDPKCVSACITGAMTKNPITGIVSNNPEKCVGCMTCLAACHIGVIKVGDIAYKCDLCGGDEEPACVKNCPNRALIYVEEGEIK